jgi:sugar phosphate isomerase/epimerase
VKLAISNLAWPLDQEERVARLLMHLDISGVELAPTKIWPDLTCTTAAARQAYRKKWKQYGMEVVAVQSLLFGRPELVIFGDRATREKTLEYLGMVIVLCADLGAPALVFGSPKNRRLGSLDRQSAWPIAVEFFGRLGEMAAREGTAVVIEANPPEYQSDFITCAQQAIELVQAVNHPGLRLHLDSACMALAGDDPVQSIEGGARLLTHFHISEPYLAPVGEVTAVDHGRFADALRRVGYGKWISIEMRQPEPFDLRLIEGALVQSSRRYLGQAAAEDVAE